MKIPLFEDVRCMKKSFLLLFAGCIAMLLLYVCGSFVITAFFNRCLRSYYCLQPAKILCIGHSMSEMAIDKMLLEKALNVPVSKYCMNGVGPVERFIILKHYLEEVKTPPEYLVYDVSGRIFSSGLAEGSYQLFLPFLNESKVCRDYLQTYLNPDEYWFLRLNPLRCYEDTRLGAVQRGLFRDWSSRKNTKFDPVSYQKKVDDGKFWHITFNEKDIKAFEEMLDLCKKHNIKVILAALPCVDILNRAEPEKYQQIMKKLQSYCQDERVRLIDFNPQYSGRYDLFADPIHVNPAGQRAVSNQLVLDLKQILNTKQERKK